MSVSDRALQLDNRKKHEAACRELRKHLPSFLAVGEQLLIIRDAGIWKETHKTLEAFMYEEFGLEKRRAYQLIEAATVKTNLVECTNCSLPLPILPSNEGQFREVAKAPPEQQAEVVKKVAEKAAEENRKPTAKDYKKVVGELLIDGEGANKSHSSPPSSRPGKPVPPPPSKEELLKLELKKTRSYAEGLIRALDDVNRVKRNTVIHPQLLKLCGQILEGLKRW